MKRVNISEDELINYYIVGNHTIAETARHFGCSAGPICRAIREYGVRKPDNLRMERIRQTSFERYGSPYSLGNSEVRKKAQNTLQEHYGVQHPMESPGIRQKAVENMKKKIPQAKEARRRTFLQRYGGTATLNSELAERVHRTMERKYGARYAMQSEELKERYRANFQDGQTWSNQEHLSKEALDILHDGKKFRDFVEGEKDRTIYGLAKKLGCSPSHLVKLPHLYHCEELVKWKGSVSHYEKEIRGWLASEGYEFKSTRKAIYPQEIDLYCETCKVGIEFNGDYYHAQKDKSYHFNKSMACREKGIRLIHIWEHEWNNPRQRPIYENIILCAIKSSKIKSIYARKCEIEVRASGEMREFFDRNNMAGFKGGKFAICLIYKGEVVMAYMMGGSSLSRGKYEWEVVRGATRLGYRVVGGASRIWKYFLENYRPKNCVYYVDFNQFDGVSMEKLGLKYVGANSSFKNYWVKTGKVTNRNPAKHAELKKALANGQVLTLWNAGTLVYLWEDEP